MNRRFINILFDIFGYSIVGILAYLFGLVLQNYNTDNGIIKILTSYNHEAKNIILAIIVQVFLIFLFGHAYATAILVSSSEFPIENGVNVCSVVGHWLETIFICMVIFLIMFQILMPGVLFGSLWILISAVSLVYVVSFFFYRMIKYDEEKKRKDKARYTLVCPAMLMICFNIYIGANMLTLMRGDWVCYVPVALIFICLLWLYIVKDKDLLMPSVISLIIIIGSGITAILKIIPPDVQLVMRNLFLAIMVSVFLSIFESWYVTFRQMKHDRKRIYMQVSMIVVALMPPLVFFLYPIQQFNFIYCLTFWIGMFATDYVSFAKVLPAINSEKTVNEREKRLIAILRALFGILTLIFLMMDKYFAFNPSWNSNDNTDIMGILFSVVTLLISILDVWIGFSNFKKDENANKTFKEWVEACKGKTSGYMLLRVAVSFLLIMCRIAFYGFMNVDESKAKLSAGFFCVFMLLTLGMSVYRWATGKNINKKEDVL